MDKIRPLVVLILVLLLNCEGDDPYLNLDEELRIEYRSLIVPASYALLADQTRRWGVPFDMYNIDFKRGGNLAEISVRFTGGCGRHRFSLYADDTYENIANFDQPIDVKLYLFHAQADEECQAFQDHVLRRVDLSFLHPGRYNLTIESAADRTAYRVDDFEIR